MFLVEKSISHPRKWLLMYFVTTCLFVASSLLPTFYPQKFSFLPAINIDTDPENMLDENEEVRLFHNKMKQEFALHDMVVVGVFNDTNPHGVFNPKTLKNIYDLTEAAKELSFSGRDRVISADIIAPNTVDNIEQGGLGSVRFEWLMKKPPETVEEAKEIAKKAANIPFLKDTLISGDNKALAIYLPITSKNISYDVAKILKDKIASFAEEDSAKYYITGLPIAQDQFGVEMFKQAAISAPMAMALIFLLMWLFFKHVKLIIAPMIVALISVIFTMGLLIITGHKIHIMSSMIPIFIMPIAVLDAVHIISDFFDKYPKTKNRYIALTEVMEELNKPMLFTSLTTCVGFASLALTPIPPVQTFGIFIALGVFFAWLLTITLIPAYIMLLSEDSLQGFGNQGHAESNNSVLSRILQRLANFTYLHNKLILLAVISLLAIAGYGITQIKINDNPVKWFEKNHEIRVADKKLNEKFAGTYMAYLTLKPKNEIMVSLSDEDYQGYSAKIVSAVKTKISTIDNRQNLISKLIDFAYEQQDLSENEEDYDEWENFAYSLENKQLDRQVFKDPEVLTFIEELQNYLLKTGYVGKSNALPDLVKTVQRELYLGDNLAYNIPSTREAVAQIILTYQSSHRPNDLWHFVTPDYQKANIWIQLKSGDNKDMQIVVNKVEEFFRNNSSKIELEHKWFGLTYINVVWQEKMVSGMANAFAGSFLIVLIMMIILFRSVSYGVLSMIPLAVTIVVIYGIIGLIGKDYDMPVAVLSSLSLGLAVDYAIHFIARSREIRQKSKNWREALEEVFAEPALAISRNVVVIGIGFLPLLAAPLVPYQTVGIFISAILLLAGFASLIILPALMSMFRKNLFKED